MEDDFQMAWDTAIVRAFFETPMLPVKRLCGKMVGNNEGLTWDAFYKLKRTPRYRYQHMCTVSRYVYAYLPNIYKALSAHGPKKMIDLIIAVNKSKNDTYTSPRDKEEVHKNYKMRREATMLKAQATTGLRETYELGEKHKRSGQWNVIK